MKQKIFLIGGDNTTKMLTSSLAEREYNVNVIHQDRVFCEEIAVNPKVRVFCGDGTLPNILENTPIHNADIVLALMPRDEDNLVTCQLAKKRFGAKKTVALITDPKKTEFFYKMGIDSVVCEVTSVAGIIEQQVFMEEISTLIPIGDGKIKITQIPVGADSPVVNKSMRDIALPNDVLIGCIVRAGEGMIPRGSTVIGAGDILVVISTASQDNLTKILTGHAPSESQPQ